MHDEFVNVKKMPTNLDGGKVESAFFGVLSKKKSWTDFRLVENCLTIISRRITEIKLIRSRFVNPMLICTFPAYLSSNYILP